MKWLASARLLRILCALGVIGGTVFFDQICSRPKVTDDCAVAAAALAHSELTIKENATIGLSEYELEKRVCVMLELGHAFSDLLRLEPQENSEFVAWNMIIIGGDLLLILVLQLWLLCSDTRSRWQTGTAFALEALAYVGSIFAFLSAVSTPDKHVLVGEPEDYVPLQHKMLSIFFFIAFAMFALDFYAWMFLADRVKFKLVCENKRRDPSEELRRAPPKTAVELVELSPSPPVAQQQPTSVVTRIQMIESTVFERNESTA